MTDAPYERGRLVVTAVGAGQFTFEVVVQRTGCGSLKLNPTFCPCGRNSLLQGLSGTLRRRLKSSCLPGAFSANQRNRFNHQQTLIVSQAREQGRTSDAVTDLNTVRFPDGIWHTDVFPAARSLIHLPFAGLALAAQAIAMMPKLGEPVWLRKLISEA
jgi:hypothetical protein